jgi:hypothetical protein
MNVHEGMYGYHLDYVRRFAKMIVVYSEYIFI